jgi:hypothetical protein
MDPMMASTHPDAAAASGHFDVPPAVPQMQLLDFFFPGFSVFSSAVHKYLGIDLNLYIPLVLLCGGMTFAWRYFSEYFWGLLETHLMSSVEIRTDDEIVSSPPRSRPISLFPSSSACRISELSRYSLILPVKLILTRDVVVQCSDVSLPVVFSRLGLQDGCAARG